MELCYLGAIFGDGLSISMNKTHFCSCCFKEYEVEARGVSQPSTYSHVIFFSTFTPVRECSSLHRNYICFLLLHYLHQSYTTKCCCCCCWDIVTRLVAAAAAAAAGAEMIVGVVEYVAVAAASDAETRKLESRSAKGTLPAPRAFLPLFH